MMTIDQDLRDEIIRLHAEICAGLADPTRILILYSLSDQSRSVGDLVKVLGMSQSTVSRHLQVLRARNLVTTTREGTSIFYSLADRRVIQALDLLRAVMSDQINRQAGLMEKAESAH